MRECAYIRVSTDLEGQDSSYINQEKMYLDLGINHIYKDRESGTSINRPQFIKMLEDCGLQVKAIKTSIKDKLVVLPTDKPSKYDKIYCKSISRFSRDTSSAIEIISLLNMLMRLRAYMMKFTRKRYNIVKEHLPWVTSFSLS